MLVCNIKNIKNEEKLSVVDSHHDSTRIIVGRSDRREITVEYWNNKDHLGRRQVKKGIRQCLFIKHTMSGIDSY